MKTDPQDNFEVPQSSASSQQRSYWRSLEERAGSRSFLETLHREFPSPNASFRGHLTRRRALQLMGASLAMAGLAGCVKMPTEKIVPYVRQPEEFIPGQPLFFATAMQMGGYGTGILVESHLGRPTKVEGNPQHAASLGGTDVFAQSSVLTLYDPDRSQAVIHLGQIASWASFLNAISDLRNQWSTTQGSGLRILTETITSPTLASHLRQLLTTFPSARWHQYEPVNRDNVREGGRLAFGEYVETRYGFDQAEVILALDSDFLFSGPGNARYARDFARRRQVTDGQATMNRLYVVESMPTVTGAMADHRLPVPAGMVEGIAKAIARSLAIPVGGPQEVVPPAVARWISAVVQDLRNYQGSSLVLAGEWQPPYVHFVTHGINQLLGNVGKTVVYTDPVEANPVSQMESLRELVADMSAGRVNVLVILGGNPVLTSPADLRFADSLSKVPLCIHLSLFDDETAQLSHWHIPEAHFLESWGDVRAYDGTVSIIQPLISPLYGGKSAHELLSALLGQADRSAYETVRGFWSTKVPKAPGASPVSSFEIFWQKALNDGVIQGTALPPKPVSWKGQSTEGNPGDQPATPSQPSAGTTAARSLEIQFRPDPTIWDGRFANNGWLQELPKPLTKLTWDNAVLISPATAQRLGLNTEDVVRLRYQGRAVKAPVWILPGHAHDSITVHLGYGRTRAGRVGNGAGFNAYLLRSADHPWLGSGVEIEKTGERYSLATTQNHFSMEGRNLVRAGRLTQFRDNPNFVREMDTVKPPYTSLFPGFQETGYAWGMSINVNACIGCGTCVVACQAENNIPVVGKEEVIRGREMHWIRIDRYYQGEIENPATYHEPIPCMQCENAPCELVCPVGATNHSSEGLNQMIYNRCVGTRYCSNNCPYKVRRFNFFQFGDWTTPSLKLQRNPNVTVRSRGVMEKCTYCVQRINAAKIRAEKENREVRDGEIVTACQAACPTEAIIFGNINDPNSRVSRLKAQPLNYGLLEELNTRPHTTYLAKLTNPNPEISSD